MIPKNIQTPEQLYPLAEAIHTFLKEKVHADDINVIVERGHELAAYMANTGKMLADAKYWKDKAMKESVFNQLKNAKKEFVNIPASVLNELIKADCSDANYLVNWITEIDKECKYQIEWLRSCLSKEKEQMKISMYHGQQISA